MSRGGGGGHTRVKTSRGRTAQSNRWLERQLNDPYVKRARAEGYRSRAAYKLTELDERFAFLKGAKRVVDLGIAPGGWAQVVRRMAPKAAIVGIDLLPVDPIDGVTILQMDFMADAAPADADRGAGRRARPGAVGHGGEHGRASADRCAADDGAGRGGGGFRDRRAGSRAARSWARCSRAARIRRWWRS